jgi:hypothetical protein
MRFNIRRVLFGRSVLQAKRFEEHGGVHWWYDIPVIPSPTNPLSIRSKAQKEYTSVLNRILPRPDHGAHRTHHPKQWALKESCFGGDVYNGTGEDMLFDELDAEERRSYR